ncbi:MAG: DUF364 domain-containing protein [Desulfitobacteriaceae bacterium]|nr:DUF364 domain-containing protein [Desulfitobacteriaceae bacterium]MDD4402573.1 DUF364 domain-containing protein [Desulfitobacteriaceae bacterium]
MWDIYDRLIAKIPEDIFVEDCLVGQHWTLVRSLNSGLAMSMVGENCCSGCDELGSITGMPVRKLAEQIKSWDFYNASLGMAAINSVLNTRERAETVDGRRLEQQQEGDVFEFFAELMRGKKVAVVGHFPVLFKYSDICQLSILERRPQPGDYPDTACEVLLPQQDIVFITGVTMTNKTLPRLLQLSKDAYVVMVGPSVPLAPFLFEYGVNMLSGTVVVDDAAVWRTAAEGGSRRIFDDGAFRFNIKQ